MSPTRTTTRPQAHCAAETCLAALHGALQRAREARGAAVAQAREAPPGRQHRAQHAPGPLHGGVRTPPLLCQPPHLPRRNAQSQKFALETSISHR